MLFSVECVLDEILVPDELNALTGGVYSVVWFNYTYNPAWVSAGELAELESAFGLSCTPRRIPRSPTSNAGGPQ